MQVPDNPQVISSIHLLSYLSIKKLHAFARLTGTAANPPDRRPATRTVAIPTPQPDTIRLHSLHEFPVRCETSDFRAPKG
jgi:hypothetical protein